VFQAAASAGVSLSAPLLAFAAAALGSPELAAVRTDAPPVIDGRLDDTTWGAAAATDRFTQKTPLEGASPSERTTLRVLYDDHALYVGFDCTQTRTPIVQRLTRRDSPVLADAVSFAVGSRGDGRSAFEFGVNAAGTMSDALRYDDTDVSPEWDESWQVRAVLTERGWSAEFKIPLRILRFGSAPEQTWDFQARRYIAARQETIEWRYIDRHQGGEVSEYGKLTGLSPAAVERHWELRPFMVGRLRRVGGVPGVPARVDASDAIGVDFRYQASRGLTLDATVNPDFAQIEADQQLLNLGNVETFYPEKRAFFLEGTEVFATPLQLLYTRRIGRVPEEPDPIGGEEFGERLADVAGPVPIHGALKLTGKLASDWTIGTLQALTAPAYVTVAWSDGRRASRVIEPTTAFAVARLRRDLDDGSHVGAAVTAVKRLEPSSDFAPAGGLADAPGADKLCPSGDVVARPERCFNDAYVGSMDWRWRSPDGDWINTGQLTASILQGGPARHVEDGSVIDPGDLGQGVYTQLARQGGEGLLGDVAFEYADRDLDYTDLGYSEGSNRYALTTNLRLRAPPSAGLLREHHYHVEQLTAFNVDGLLTNNVNKLGTYGTFFNGLMYSLYAHYAGRRYDDREVGNGLALQRAAAAGVEVGLTSDTSKSLSFDLFTLSQWIETGANFSGQASIALRPTSELALELGPSVSYTVGEPRFALEGEAPGEYLFGKLTAKSVSTQLRLSYAFLPELTLQAYGQVFFATGHYTSLSLFRATGVRSTVTLDELEPYSGPVSENPDFEEGVIDVSLVFHWEYTEGASLYGVYTHSQTLDTTLPLGGSARLDFSSFTEARPIDTLLFKLSYWWGN
jgi:uncharacterized protein DUF5916